MYIKTKAKCLFAAICGSILLVPTLPVQATEIMPIETAPSWNGMVNLADVSDDIIMDVQNATADNWLGQQFYSSNTALVTKPLAKELLEAQARFSELGYSLKIWDAYRQESIQSSMNIALANIAGTATANAFIPPVGNYSQHCRGIAVDVTLVETATGKEVPMPSGYCDFTNLAAVEPGSLRHTTVCTDEELTNEKTLRDVMKLPRMSNEWWHFYSTVQNTDYNWMSVYPRMDFTIDEWYQHTKTYFHENTATKAYFTANSPFEEIFPENEAQNKLESPQEEIFPLKIEEYEEGGVPTIARTYQLEEEQSPSIISKESFDKEGFHYEYKETAQKYGGPIYTIIFAGSPISEGSTKHTTQMEQETTAQNNDMGVQNRGPMNEQSRGRDIVLLILCAVGVPLTSILIKKLQNKE